MDFDLRDHLDADAVQQRGFVAPLADRLDRRRSEQRVAFDQAQVFDRSVRTDDRAEQHAPRDALLAGLERVLPALLYTTGIVSLGFLVLAASEFTFTRNVGLLTAAAMLICLFADLTLLPAFLLRLKSSVSGGSVQAGLAAQQEPAARSL